MTVIACLIANQMKGTLLTWNTALRRDVGIVWPQHHTRTEILLIHRCKEQNFGLCRYVQRLVRCVLLATVNA